HWSIRAREVFGPARYSEYQVTVILLTDRGVAKISKDLDFRKGELHPGDREKVFHYDAISAADILRVEVKFHGDHRTVIELDDNASEQKPDASQVDFVVENFDEAFLDEQRGETVKNLSDITMDISGMRSAHRMLRAIAMSTREWIAIEAQKREERLLDFRGDKNASPAEEQESATGAPMRQTTVP